MKFVAVEIVRRVGDRTKAVDDLAVRPEPIADLLGQIAANACEFDGRVTFHLFMDGDPSRD